MQVTGVGAGAASRSTGKTQQQALATVTKLEAPASKE
jgi:hypothetical protein